MGTTGPGEHSADGPPRLLTPWADPHKYEWPMDWYFGTAEEALKVKKELASDEEWVLTVVTLRPIEMVRPEGEEE